MFIHQQAWGFLPISRYSEICFYEHGCTSICWLSILSLLWGIYPEAELLDHMVFLFDILKNWIPFSTAAAPFYIPTGSAYRWQFFHIPANTCFVLWVTAILNGVKTSECGISLMITFYPFKSFFLLLLYGYNFWSITFIIFMKSSVSNYGVKSCFQGWRAFQQVGADP